MSFGRYDRLLGEACVTGDVLLLKTAIENGGDIDHVDLNFACNTPLHKAALHNRTAAANVLMRQMASVNVPNDVLAVFSHFQILFFCVRSRTEQHLCILLRSTGI